MEAYVDDGSVYIRVYGGSDWIEVQISTAEIDYRAELYDDEYEETDQEQESNLAQRDLDAEMETIPRGGR
jgi:hypothetical protein